MFLRYKIVASDPVFCGQKKHPMRNMDNDSIILASNEGLLSSPDNNYRMTQM